jgi:hypothetical protein
LIGINVHSPQPIDAQGIANGSQGSHSTVYAAATGGSASFVGGKGEQTTLHHGVARMHRDPMRRPILAKLLKTYMDQGFFVGSDGSACNKAPKSGLVGQVAP